nr:RecName: Full=Unknown protein 10 from 2D-PAGE [Fructilactobacillus sanfranciscensis]
SGADTTFLTK